MEEKKTTPSPIKALRKPKILIVDDSPMNRLVLTNLLGDDFEITEAVNGEKGLDLLKKGSFDLVIIEMILPKVSGLQFLKYCKETEIGVPVMVISSINDSYMMGQAYDNGAVDYIVRPFNSGVVLKKIQHTLFLNGKEKGLIDLLFNQMVEKENNVSSLILILSQIVESRNEESGSHVVNIKFITDTLLHQLIKKTSKYKVDEKAIEEIVIASSLHDIGKIAIPDSILNKPGALTKKEFDVMKTHSYIGYVMLKKNAFLKENSLLERAEEIAHWHHEKWDGKGYPDGLRGDSIPISAQVVSIADCYDALTSKRVYKNAISHEQAIAMINNGECGQFNPLLLECLNEVSAKIKDKVFDLNIKDVNEKKVRAHIKELLKSQL